MKNLCLILALLVLSAFGQTVFAGHGSFSGNMVFGTVGSTVGSFDGPAELPRVTVPSAMSGTPAPGGVTTVNAGGSIQTALNNASCGTTIKLQAGAVFTVGQITVPAKNCDINHWIIVETSAYSSLPPEGTRLTPCYSGYSSLPGRPAYPCSSPSNTVAQVVYNSTGRGPFKLADGASFYRFIGLEVTRVSNGTGILISTSGDGVISDHIIVDRCWFHGQAGDETQGGVDFNEVTNGALIDSYISDIHCIGSCSDSQAFEGGTSTTQDGPWKIQNNFLESSGQAILIGGGAATYVPTDITIMYNHMFKPLTWMPGVISTITESGTTATMTLTQNAPPSFASGQPLWITGTFVSLTGAPTNPDDSHWTYTFATTRPGAGSNAWAGATVAISGYTGCTGNNALNLPVTASTTTTVTVTNANGSLTGCAGTPIMTFSTASQAKGYNSQQWTIGTVSGNVVTFTATAGLDSATGNGGSFAVVVGGGSNSSWVGRPFTVKNIFELKTGIRVLLDSNILENAWGGFGQFADAVLLTPKSTGTCPVCAVTDVTIRYDKLSHIGSAFEIADIVGATGHSALLGERYSIHDVVADDISRYYGGFGDLLENLGNTFVGPAPKVLNSVTVNHVTAFPDTTGGHLIETGNTHPTTNPMYGFVFTNNLVMAGKYPVWDVGEGPGDCAQGLSGNSLAVLNACWASYTFTNNAIIADTGRPWPSGNFFPTTTAAVGFTNYNGGNGGDYTLQSSSPYKNAGTDGKDLGADIVGLNAALANVK